MAKALKVGEAVTVRKELRLRRKDPAYKQGLKRLLPGEIGHIVTVGDDSSRSVIAEFKGIQVTLASQRLDRTAPLAVPAAESESTAESTNGNGRRTRRGGGAGLGLVNYNTPDFVAEVANKLLLTGGLEPDPETIVIQIKLSDLPAPVQKQVKSLIQAKLDLGRQPRAPRRNARKSNKAEAAPQPKPRGRPGRKPKNAQP